jgi:hypothetical protein
VKDEPERAAAMRRSLTGWLDQTDARFPAADSSFDPARRAARLEHVRTSQRAKLELRHAAFVMPDYDPGNCWWGSLPPDTCD